MTFRDILACPNIIRPRSRALVLCAVAVTLTLITFRSCASAAGVGRSASGYSTTDVTSGSTDGQYGRHRSAESPSTTPALTPAAAVPDVKVVSGVDTATLIGYCQGGAESFERVPESDTEYGRRGDGVQLSNARPLISDHNKVDSIQSFKLLISYW